MAEDELKRIWEFPVHFILGFNRSGTTLLLSLLRGHEEIETGFEEPDHLYRLIAKTARYERHYEETLKIPKAEIKALYDRSTAFFIKHFYRELAGRFGKKMAVLKHPSLSPYYHRLAEMFPDAKFIILLRHPYDLTASVLHHIDNDPWDQAKHIFPGEIPQLCDMIKRYHRKELLQALPDGRSVKVKFEEFLLRPMDTLGLILAHFKATASLTAINHILFRAAKGKLPAMGRKITSTKIVTPVNRFSALEEEKRVVIKAEMSGFCKELGYKTK